MIDLKKKSNDAFMHIMKLKVVADEAVDSIARLIDAIIWTTGSPMTFNDSIGYIQFRPFGSADTINVVEVKPYEKDNGKCGLLFLVDGSDEWIDPMEKGDVDLEEVYEYAVMWPQIDGEVD